MREKCTQKSSLLFVVLFWIMDLHREGLRHLHCSGQRCRNSLLSLGHRENLKAQFPCVLGDIVLFCLRKKMSDDSCPSHLHLDSVHFQSLPGRKNSSPSAFSVCFAGVFMYTCVFLENLWHVKLQRRNMLWYQMRSTENPSWTEAHS